MTKEETEVLKRLLDLTKKLEQACNEATRTIDGLTYNLLPLAVEHDPKACKVCREHGTWANTPDTLEWLQAHLDAGIGIALDLNRAMEYEDPAATMRTGVIEVVVVQVNGVCLRFKAPNQPFSMAQLQAMVEGYITVWPDPVNWHGMKTAMLVDEEAIPKGKPINYFASGLTGGNQVRGDAVLVLQGELM